MTALQTVLEQRGIASAREIAEAVARCELHGGDLTTSLLQFVSADEARLSAALADCHGLPAAVVGVLPAASESLRQCVPRSVAERYCCLPLSLSGGVLTVAVPEPLSADVVEELSFAFGLELRMKLSLEVRIRQAIARDYQLPLSPRNQRGIARLEGDLENAPQHTPTGLWPGGSLSTLPRPPSDPPRPRSEPPRPNLRSESPRRSLRASRPRGPFNLAVARRELAAATSRNDVLDAFFSFACQYFEYSALFAVHSSLAEGLNAWGPGATRDAVQAIGVPLDLPSSLSEASESCRRRITRLERSGIDATLASDLRRTGGGRVLLLPVCLRGRCAVLFYADNGNSDVLEREIGDVAAITDDVARALGRIILQRKREAAAQRKPNLAELSASLSAPPVSLSAPPVSPAPRTAAAQAVQAPEPLAIDVTVEVTPFAPAVSPAAPAVSPAAPAEGKTRSPAAVNNGKHAARSEGGEDPVFLLARPLSKPPSEQLRGEPSTDKAELSVAAAAPEQSEPAPRPPTPTQTEQSQTEQSQTEQSRTAPSATPNGLSSDTPPSSGAPRTTISHPPRSSSAVRRPRLPSVIVRDDPPPPESVASPKSSPTATRRGSSPDNPRVSGPAPDAELIALVDRLCEGDPTARRDLNQLGTKTLPLLMARFPGPVITERAGPSSRASECGPLLQALAAIGSPAMPDIRHSSEHGDERVRRWATLLLGELPDLESCQAVVKRLADDSPRVNQAAVDAARLLLRSTAANQFRKTLFDVAEAEETPLQLRMRTLEQVAKLKDGASVPRLIGLLVKDTEAIVHKALWALTIVTRQDFARDSQAWWEWWHSEKGRHRMQWLIESLDHRDPRLRKAAALELASEAGDGFGYAEILPQERRHAIQARYRQWWLAVGARRFGRVP